MEKCASWNIQGIEIGDALLRENKRRNQELLEKKPYAGQLQQCVL